MSEPITHQSIADRSQQLNREQAAARKKAEAEADKPFVKEREALQELCGGIGHVFTWQADWYGQMLARRRCAACGADEVA